MFGTARLLTLTIVAWIRSVSCVRRSAGALLQIAKVKVERVRAVGRGRSLVSDTKDPMNKPDLSENIALCYPPNLSFSDHVHRLKALQCIEGSAH